MRIRSFADRQATHKVLLTAVRTLAFALAIEYRGRVVFSAAFRCPIADSSYDTFLEAAATAAYCRT